jgi:hypothetical protein
MERKEFARATHSTTPPIHCSRVRDVISIVKNIEITESLLRECLVGRAPKLKLQAKAFRPGKRHPAKADCPWNEDSNAKGGRVFQGLLIPN